MSNDKGFECPSCHHSYSKSYYPPASRPGLDPCNNCVQLQPLKDHGCFVAIAPDGTLISCPMLANGEPERENLGSVTHPEVGLLDATNAKLGSAFWLEEFAGL